MSNKLESEFKKRFTDRLEDAFPGCVILKNDANLLQGIPDTTVLYRDCWVVLEFKQNARAKKQPNQPWYIEKLNDMSYAAFVYPENEEEVFYGIQEAFSSGRISRATEPE